MEPEQQQNGDGQAGEASNKPRQEKRPLWAAADRYKKIKKPFLWKEVAKEYALTFVPHTVHWYGHIFSHL
jgi:hypothetical protein